MERITTIIGREILDSRGVPALEVEVLAGRHIGRAAVPSGASCGTHEAWELRDGDPQRYQGKGLYKALASIDEVKRAFIGQPLGEQQRLDALLCELDGTDNKARLGANTLLGISLAYAKATAAATGVPLFKSILSSEQPNQAGIVLPVPMINILNGGQHANNGIDVQEFMIMPIGAKTFAHGVQISCEVFHTLKELLEEAGFSTALGDEGGFAPPLKTNEAAIEWVIRAVEKAGYALGEEVALCLDVASSELYDPQTGLYRFNGKTYSSAAFADQWAEWVARYPIFSIEDPMAEDDWAGWKLLTQQLGKKVQLVGDDLFVTHPQRLKRGIDEGVGNAILIKLNQIGTLSETLSVIAQARTAQYACIVSHRSGETEDCTIADLSVATQVGQIKTGSVARGERTAKYNQLLRIAQQAGDEAVYAGKLLQHSILNSV